METEEWIGGEIEGMWGREWEGRREVKLWLVSKINKKILKKGKKEKKIQECLIKNKTAKGQTSSLLRYARTNRGENFFM